MQSLIPVFFLVISSLLLSDAASSQPSKIISAIAQKNQTLYVHADAPDVPPVVPTLPPAPTPTPTTTVAPSTTATPYVPERKFDTASFIGGFVLCAGLTAIGFVSLKFYKARVELTYRTL